MTNITAVAKLTHKTKSTDGTQTLLTFSADYADGRNKEWAKWTPALSLDMHVKNEVAEQFDFNGAYLLTFEKQEPTA